MKRFLLSGFLLLLVAWIAGCAYTRSPYLNQDLVRETWMKDLERDPNQWAVGSDKWFLTGDPNATETANKDAPYSKAISTMQVKVSDFTNIVTNGNFELQIFGTHGANSVYVYGPNNDVRETRVHAERGTLYLNQSKNAKKSMHRVIIRVGINMLTRLDQRGGGLVEAIRLPNSQLSIHSTGGGNVYVSGNMNLRRVETKGPGSVTVFGAETPLLDIKTAGSGHVNVSGKVGIHSIIHHGKGNVNIVGANSDSLKIKADGKGKIGISGVVNAQEIQARDHVSVLIDCINSNKLYIYALNRARVGVTGNAKDLYMYSSDVSAIFGRNLFSQNAYAQAKDGSHINVAATNKVFASAVTNASVYFFGEPRIMSQFVSGNGVVIPVWTGGPRKYPNRMTAKLYKDAPVIDPIAMRTTTHHYDSPYKYKWVNGKLVKYKPKKS